MPDIILYYSLAGKPDKKILPYLCHEPDKLGWKGLD